MSIRKKARELGIPATTLMWRIKHGWSEDRLGYKRPAAPEGSKYCSKCHKIKKLENFYKRSKRNGFISGCKECKKTAPKGGEIHLSSQ